jgi:hypothetical protein
MLSKPSTTLITHIFRGLTHGFCVDWDSNGDCDELVSEYGWERLRVAPGYDGTLKQLLEEDQSSTIIHYLSLGPRVSLKVVTDYLASPRIVFNHEQIIQVISCQTPSDLQGYVHYGDGLHIHNQWQYLARMT